jgi:AcrR family transcriptional regulator
MPKLWDGTIEAHRIAVREATIEATATLVARHGVAGVTMSQIASETGIGRATLYKYFPDIGSILRAWHERQVSGHVEELAAARNAARGDAITRLRAVLTAYAQLSHPRDGSELVAMLHRGAHVTRAERDLRELVADLLREAVGDGDARGDVPPEELAVYCLHALSAAAALDSRAAIGRLVDVTLSGVARR